MITDFLFYIDPGTGSMLFSIFIGAAATLYFLGRAAILKLKILFSRNGVQTQTKALPYVIYNEGNQYWNVFKPICDEFEKRQIELTFLTSSKDDPVFDGNYSFVKPEYIGEGNKAFARLNFLEADVVLMTTPGLDVYQLKRSKNVKCYAHILHSVDSGVSYRMFGIDYFDAILLSADRQMKDIRALESMRELPAKELVSVGCPYLDVYQQKIAALSDKKNAVFTVLISPSWGKNAILSRFGEKLIDPLIATGWNIIIRPHPQSRKSETEMLKRLTDRYKDNPKVEWDFNRENIYSLAKADVMISDFSAIVFDYAFLCDKPFVYVSSAFDLRAYDSGDLPYTIWQYKILPEIGIELTENNFSNIAEIVKSAADNEQLKSARQNAKEDSWFYRGHAGEKTADWMIQKREQLLAANHSE